jgi:hypothetical protein
MGPKLAIALPANLPDCAGDSPFAQPDADRLSTAACERLCLFPSCLRPCRERLIDTCSAIYFHLCSRGRRNGSPEQASRTKLPGTQSVETGTGGQACIPLREAPASNFGMLALLIREEPTLRAALQFCFRYTRLHNAGTVV